MCPPANWNVYHAILAGQGVTNNASERITEDKIINLLQKEVEIWYADGTFSCCPRAFKQIYTMYVKKGNRFIFRVYACFLPSKAIEEHLAFSKFFHNLVSLAFLPLPLALILS